MGPPRQLLAVLIFTARSTPCSSDRSEGFQVAEARSNIPIHLSRLRRRLVNSTVPVRPGDGERSDRSGVNLLPLAAFLQPRRLRLYRL
jgi:hypothetical protein